MTHPLTDKICFEMALKSKTWNLGFSNDDMRAAYDKGAADRLEQVIEWLSYNLGIFEMEDERYIYIKEDFLSNTCINEDKVIEDLKKAMRPQQQEDN